MEKDFDSWNAKKSDLNNRQDIPFFHEREIWFCHVGVNIGVEVDGVGINFLRPVVIIKKINNTAFIAIPLTRTPRQGKFYFPMTDDPGDSFAVLSQVRLLDARRLFYQSRVIPEAIFQELRQSFLSYFGDKITPTLSLDDVGSGRSQCGSCDPEMIITDP